MSRYIIVVKMVNSDIQWEEDLTSMVITEDSPHFETHEEGIHHEIPEGLSLEVVQHYAKNLIEWFNANRRRNERERELISVRIED